MTEPLSVGQPRPLKWVTATPKSSVVASKRGKGLGIRWIKQVSLVLRGQTPSFGAEREMPLKNPYSEKRVYQLKVALRGIRPPIWRRILVPHDIWLDELHRVLQIVMGWTDRHLHKFVIKGTSYRHPAIDRLQGDRAENETSFKLYRIVL
jgi:hypothetical protein